MAKPSPVDGIDADTPLDEAARRTLAVRLHDVRALESKVTRERDAENLHDMRVATRRLRAALGMFAKGRLDGEREEVKRLGDALGAVRDLDVQLAWLDGELRRERPAAEEPGIRALHEQRRKELGGREQASLAALDRWITVAVPRLEQALADHFGHGRLGGRALRQRLRRRLSRLEPLMEEAIESTDARTAHRVRIAVKKLRYDSELLEAALPDEIDPILKALAPLQETLGDLHDRDVRLDLAVRFAARAQPREQPGALALLAEELHDRDRLAAELQAELRRWQADRLARALRRPLK